MIRHLISQAVCRLVGCDYLSWIDCAGLGYSRPICTRCGKEER